jgi:hypothetical protein
MKRSLILVKPAILLAVLVLFSSWGSIGHRKISEHAPASFPSSMAFLKNNYTLLLGNHASDADYRKQTDPTESPKHYIDIDDYAEYIETGKIPMAWDSVLALHGYSFVVDKGILPWATLTAYDTLRACFQRKDWTKAGLVAADLGHYVADGHMPLHITRNYNGQFTGQSGIHSRYESSMISRFGAQILYEDDSVAFIPDVKGTVFTYLYYNYQFVDSLLIADRIADSIAGGTSGDAYYAALWNETGSFTIDLFKRASYALAGLIHTAWVEAGSPVMTPSALADFAGEPTTLGQNTPNPFTGVTHIPLNVKRSKTHVSLVVMDGSGNMVKVLCDASLSAGMTTFTWDGSALPAGIYYIVLKEDSSTTVKKAVLLH